MYPRLTHSPVDAPSRGRSARAKTYRFWLVTLGAFSLVATAFTTPVAAQSPPVQVVSVTATPAEVPTGGGTVVVNGVVRNGTTCQVKLLSQQSFPIVYASNVRNCSTSFTARVTIGRNPSAINRTVAFALIARGGTSLFTAGFYVTLAGSPPAQIMSVTSAPAELPTGGGTVVVNGIVRNGTTCQVKLLSQQSFPVVYASNVRHCSTSFTARVTIGRNPSPINRTVAFALIARGGASAFTGRFYVTLAGPQANSRATPPPTAAPTTPPTTIPPTTPPTTTPPTTPSTHAALQAWVDNTLEPDLATQTTDLNAWTNCYDDNGDSPDGCESYGSQLASDATSAESDPPAPVASVQNAWSAVLSDTVNEGTDLANDDLSDGNTVASQAEADLKSLQAALVAQGINNA